MPICFGWYYNTRAVVLLFLFEWLDRSMLSVILWDVRWQTRQTQIPKRKQLINLIIKTEIHGILHYLDSNTFIRLVLNLQLTFYKLVERFICGETLFTLSYILELKHIYSKIITTKVWSIRVFIWYIEDWQGMNKSYKHYTPNYTAYMYTHTTVMLT